MKRASASIGRSTLNLAHHAKPTCTHDNKKTTTYSGLLRVACHECNQVSVDFIDLADPGILFRIPRLS
jgi:hypothetical protein